MSFLLHRYPSFSIEQAFMLDPTLVHGRRSGGGADVSIFLGDPAAADWRSPAFAVCVECPRRVLPAGCRT